MTNEKTIQYTEGLEYTLINNGTVYAVSGIGTATDTDINIPPEYNGMPVIAIDKCAFENCLEIESVVIPENVEYIEFAAFFNCQNLRFVYMPKSLNEIFDDAFHGCYSLKSVTITDMYAWCSINFWTEESNPLFYAHFLYLKSENVSHIVFDVIIPEGIEAINDYTFIHCQCITKITFPQSIQSIGSRAFEGCIRLKSISLPNHYIRIDGEFDGAFDGCLRVIECESDMRYLGEYVIGHASNYSENVEIKEGIKHIGEYAFFNVYCESIEIPKSVKSIGARAFYCSSIKRIFYSGTISEWNNVYKDLCEFGKWNDGIESVPVICSDGKWKEQE